MSLSLVKSLENDFVLARVGGKNRIYNVLGNMGIVFLVDNTEKALGIIIDPKSGMLVSLGVWTKFNIDVSPDYILDIPHDATLENAYSEIVKFIKNPRQLSESFLNEVESLKTIPTQEFVELVRNELDTQSAARMTNDDLATFAKQHNVRIPSEIKSGAYRQGSFWNLQDLSPEEKAAEELGGKVSNKKTSPEAKRLAQISAAAKMETDGKVFLMARKANGEVFRIPNISALENQFEKLLGEELSNTNSESMESQYQKLEGKIKLVAGGKGSFVRSLLITGGPSTGKTFRVMKTIKDLGLKQGEDYITKKGKITARSLYRILIEQLNGLSIFDDCDSVFDDPNGVNMLKGALDTDPVRTVDYDVSGLLNTGAMSFERREVIVEAMSSVLRGVPTADELKTIEDLMPAKLKENDDPFDSSFWDNVEGGDWDSEYDGSDASEKPSPKTSIKSPTKQVSSKSLSERIMDAENWVMRNLPNKIDFKGRIIFISNLEYEQIDSAIRTRATSQQMDFGDAEMLAFIRTIKNNIKADGMTEDEKSEVLDYIEKLWKVGKLKSAINFRLVMKSFDLYILKHSGYDWKALVGDL